MKKFIPVNEPCLDGNERSYLNECVDSGWISSEGPFVERFENSFADYCGRKYAVAVSSGTAALELAFESLQLEEGSEVAMSAFSIIACAAAVLRSNLKPVFADCDPDTWNATASQIEKVLTKKTKALLIPHIYGLPAEMSPLLSLARERGLKVVEDAAQMHGQDYCGQKCGSFGDISVFSFYANKLVTCGEGGMLLCDDPSLAERLRLLRNQAFRGDRRFYHEELGHSYRMTNMQAAVGLAQLERLDLLAKKKREMGTLYQEHLREVADLRLPIEETTYAKNIYWAFGVVLEGRLKGKAGEIAEIMRKNGIGTRPFFYPLHKQPALSAYGVNVDLPNSELLGENGFYLPSSPALKADEIKQVADVLKSAVAEACK